MPSSSSSVNTEISSTGTTAEITFVAFILCRIDESYDGDNDDDDNDDNLHYHPYTSFGFTLNRFACINAAF